MEATYLPGRSPSIALSDSIAHKGAARPTLSLAGLKRRTAEKPPPVASSSKSGDALPKITGGGIGPGDKPELKERGRDGKAVERETLETVREDNENEGEDGGGLSSPLSEDDGTKSDEEEAKRKEKGKRKADGPVQALGAGDAGVPLKRSRRGLQSELGALRRNVAEREAAPKRKKRLSRPKGSGSAVDSRPLDMTETEVQQGEETLWSFLKMARCEFCGEHENCIACQSCGKSVCASTSTGCVSGAAVGREYEVNPDFKFRCAPCLYAAKTTIPNFFAGKREHYKESLHKPASCSTFLLISLFGYNEEPTASLDGVGALVAPQMKDDRVKNYVHIRMSIDGLKDYSTWRKARARASEVLAADPQAMVCVSFECHDAGKGRVAVSSTGDKAMLEVLVDMLGPTLYRTIRDHSGPRILWVLSCLTPNAYDVRLEQCRTILSNHVFHAVGTFSTHLARWSEMRQWVTSWLARWYGGDSIFEAMVRTQQDMSAKLRLIAVLIGGIPKDVGSLLSTKGFVEEPPSAQMTDMDDDDMAMEVDSDDSPACCDAVQFWSTGNKAEPWTGPVRTTRDRLAMTCPVHDNELWGRNVHHFPDTLVPMKCRAKGCLWKSAYIQRPSFIHQSELATAARHGVEHRYLWYGPFPMPTILKSFPQ